MNRIDDLAENSLVERVNSIVRNAEELRATAQGFGSDSVLLYRVYSANAYDIQVTNIGFMDKVVEVTFTPTDQLTTSLGGVFSVAVTGQISPGYGVQIYSEVLVPENGISKIRLYLSGSDFDPVPWFNLKFYFSTNGSGTISATLV